MTIETRGTIHTLRAISLVIVCIVPQFPGIRQPHKCMVLLPVCLLERVQFQLN
jgi:hypothetical protein